MILTIDIGNTHTMFALYEEETMLGQWRLATDPRRTADEFTLWLERFLDRIKKRPITIKQVIIACVVPQNLFSITKAVEQQWNLPPLIVTSQLMAEIGMQIDTEKPDEVGADRMINALAAWHHYGKAAIVVDFGTATTFDVIDGQGAYCGGSIAPGINLSLEALHKAAAKLPNIAIAKPGQAIGRSTEMAMQSGIFFGYLGLIERIITEIKSEMTDEAIVIATGGLGGLFAGASDAIDRHVPDLTMDGLRLAARKYQEIN